MPVIGITDRRPALPRLGIIRKGGPKVGNRAGPDLTYLRFVVEPELADVGERFTSIYGDQPTKLDIYLLSDEVDENFEVWQEAWRAGGLVHRCDGETAVLWRDKNGEMQHRPIPCPDLNKPKRAKDRCKLVGRLSVLLPELERIAVVTVLTTSINDILSIDQSLKAAKALQKGRLAGIPLVLCRREREISTPTDDGKRARRKKSLLFVEPAHHYAVAALRAMDITPLLLPQGQANGAVDDEEEEDRLVDVITGEIVAPSENHGNAARAAGFETHPGAPKTGSISAATDEAKKSEPTTIPPFKNVGEFLQWCKDTFRLLPAGVWMATKTFSNIGKASDIADPSQLKTLAEGLVGIYVRPAEPMPEPPAGPEDGAFSEQG